jgi:enoyl-CoA hydratase/carnithine racemase
MTDSVNAGAPGQPPDMLIEGRIATLTLRRPGVANRLELQDLERLREQIAQVNATPEVLVLRLAAQGRHFCSGFNLSEADGGANRAGPLFEAVASEIEHARPITIAAIQGGVYGGATDLALACDFRLGTPACEMFVPAARLGLLFYRGGLERCVSRLGLQTAKRVMLAAEKFDAEEMLAIGFLDRLLPTVGALMPACDEFSATLAGMAPLALLGMKKHLNGIAGGTLDVAGFARDVAAADASSDLREGTLAWREKRRPVFRGV